MRGIGSEAEAVSELPPPLRQPRPVRKGGIGNGPFAVLLIIELAALVYVLENAERFIR